MKIAGFAVPCECVDTTRLTKKNSSAPASKTRRRAVGRRRATCRVTPSGEMRTRRNDSNAAAMASTGTPMTIAAVHASERRRSDT